MGVVALEHLGVMLLIAREVEVPSRHRLTDRAAVSSIGAIHQSAREFLERVVSARRSDDAARTFSGLLLYPIPTWWDDGKAEGVSIVIYRGDASCIITIGCGVSASIESLNGLGTRHRLAYASHLFDLPFAVSPADIEDQIERASSILLSHAQLEVRAVSDGQASEATQSFFGATGVYCG